MFGGLLFGGEDWVIGHSKHDKYWNCYISSIGHQEHGDIRGCVLTIELRPHHHKHSQEKTIAPHQCCLCVCGVIRYN